MELKLTITELANLTNKTRPTIYKYISCYKDKLFDDIPYSFIELFKYMDNEEVTRKEIIDYCKEHFAKANENPKVEEIIKLITEYQNELNLDGILEALKGELNNGN